MTKLTRQAGDADNWKLSLFGSVTSTVACELAPQTVSENLKKTAEEAGFSVQECKDNSLKILTGNAVITCRIDRSAVPRTNIIVKAERDYSLPLPLLIPSIVSFAIFFIKCIQAPGGKLTSIDPLTVACLMVILYAALTQEMKKSNAKKDIERFKLCLSKALQ